MFKNTVFTSLMRAIRMHLMSDFVQAKPAHPKQHIRDAYPRPVVSNPHCIKEWNRNIELGYRSHELESNGSVR